MPSERKKRNVQGTRQDEKLMEHIPDAEELDDFIPSSQPDRVGTSVSLEAVAKERVEESQDLDPSMTSIEDTLPVDALSDTEVLTTPFDATADFIPPSAAAVKRKDNFPPDESEPASKKRQTEDETLVACSEDIWGPTQLSPKTGDLSRITESPTTLESQNNSSVNDSPTQLVYKTTPFTSDNDDENKTGDSVTEISDSNHTLSRVKSKSIDSSLGNGMKGEAEDEVVILDSSSDLNSTFTRPRTDALKNGDVIRVQDMADNGHLDSTVDINDVVFSNPNSPNEVQMLEELKTGGSTTKSLGKVISEARLNSFKEASGPQALVQKHSTPENHASKMIKIDETTSSIDPIHDSERSSGEIEIPFSLNLTLNCVIKFDTQNQTTTSKKILKVKEVGSSRRRDLYESDSTDKSKRTSCSSSGTVYSDKSNLPYMLPPRRPGAFAARIEESSMDELGHFARQSNRRPWINEYLIAEVCDDAIFRVVAQHFREKDAALTEKKKPKPLRDVRKRNLGGKLVVEEESLTESSSTAIPHTSSSNGSEGRPRSENIDSNQGVNEAVPKVSVHAEMKESLPDKSTNAAASLPDESTEPGTPLPDESTGATSSVDEEPQTTGGKMTLKEGLPIFARWTDKRYYSGKIKCASKYDRWEVEFDDHTVKILREDLILPADWLTKGRLVFALTKDKYEPGKIADVKRTKEKLYTVELDSSNQRVTVPSSDLILSEDMASIIREQFNPPAVSTPGKLSADIDFDNVIAGKRVREARTPARTSVQSVTSSASKKQRTVSKSEDTPVMSDVEKSAVNRSVNESPEPGVIEKGSRSKRERPVVKEEREKEKTSVRPASKSTRGKSQAKAVKSEKQSDKTNEEVLPAQVPSKSARLKRKEKPESATAVTENTSKEDTTVKPTKQIRQRVPAPAKKRGKELETIEEAAASPPPSKPLAKGKVKAKSAAAAPNQSEVKDKATRSSKTRSIEKKKVSDDNTASQSTSVAIVPEVEKTKSKTKKGKEKIDSPSKDDKPTTGTRARSARTASVQAKDKGKAKTSKR